MLEPHHHAEIAAEMSPRAAGNSMQRLGSIWRLGAAIRWIGNLPDGVWQGSRGTTEDALNYPRSALSRFLHTRAICMRASGRATAPSNRPFGESFRETRSSSEHLACRSVAAMSSISQSLKAPHGRRHHAGATSVLCGSGVISAGAARSAAAPVPSWTTGGGCEGG
jgi:hypothetical protein